MANILLLGASDAIRRLSSLLSADHTLHAFPTDATSAPLDDRLVVARSPIEIPGELDAVFDLDWTHGPDRHRRDEVIRESINDGALLFVSCLTATATSVAAAHPGRPVIGISWIPPLVEEGTVLEIAPALQTPADGLDRAVELLGSLIDRKIEVVVDRVALVSARILAMIVNEAAFAMMEGVADAEDIDVAMKLGTNYPEGPLRWADRIGADLVVAILQALHDEYQEERYRPCVLLKQYARARRAFYAPVA